MKQALVSSYAFGVYVFILQILVKLVVGIDYSGMILALFAGMLYAHLHGGVSSIREKINVVGVYLGLSLLLGIPYLIASSGSSYDISPPVFVAIIVAVLAVYGLVMYAFFSWGERVQQRTLQRTKNS